MQKIYPKTCENLKGEEYLRKYIKKYKGVEIQFFHKDEEKLVDFNVSPVIEKIMDVDPEIEEITVHPPLSEYDIEQVLLSDKSLFFKLLNDLVNLSNKYSIKMNIIFHSHLTFIGHKYCTINYLKEAMNVLEGSNVKILLENLFMFEENGLCDVLKVCKEIDNEHLKMCIDVCHLYCRAHIVKMPIEEFLEIFLNKELCSKYIYQIHFADTKDNDGYMKKETHGRVHDSITDVKYDLDLLKKYGIEDKLIVTEVSEDDYTSRKDQIDEIKYLEEIYNN